MWGDDIVLFGVKPQELDKYYHIALPFIEKCLDKTDALESIEEIESTLRKSMRQLWIVYKSKEPIAAVLTRIEQTKYHKIGSIQYAGGKDIAAWYDLLSLWQEWFIKEGCDYMEIAGRKGWKKMFLEHGLKEKTVIYRKALNHG